MNEHEYDIHPIGAVRREGDKAVVYINAEFREALLGLEEFSHVYVLWWADRHDNSESRAVLQCKPPYADGRTMGIFATRAEYRPNPVAFTVCKIEHVDATEGRLVVNNIDALDETPVLDLKPYYPVCDRVKQARIPDWLSDWPDWWPKEGFGL